MVSLENVSWSYARASGPALTDLSVRIGEGEFVAVMGENGAGKTTFCRLLNGLVPHSMPGALLGTVMVDGTDTRLSSVARLSEKVGMAFDDPETQFFTARVFDEVAFALENMVLPPGEIVEKTRWALDAAGLSEYADRPPATLSGGQKQRLAIAAALAQANRVLVLDEPCSRLDPVCTREVLSFIRDLRADKRLTVVMATGSPQEAADFADRVCLLKNGRLLAFDAPGRVFSDGRLLDAAGVDPPEVSQFAFRMAGLGEPLPRFPVTVDGAVESVLEWYDGRK
ncbi:MAG: ATP-binding cassette domain-containing protein [Treponema sp.]|nr:ATP-binding cassette domain-containing protein [Treponema sp.]